jgi:CRISPR-associated endonuclease Cas1 subtype II
MSFRTVVINKHCKLDFRMNYMEIRQPEGKKRIYLDEIEVLIVENPAISLTGCLLSELMKRKVKVIFCDGKHNPQGEVVSYYGGYDSARKLRRQLRWADEIKGEIWTAIVTEKIRQQARFLHEMEHEREAGILDGYVSEIAYRDKYNREGLAAKVYFAALFGEKFHRDDLSPVNAALDYGYAILLSLVNREITALGYLTQLGIFHDNIFNPFNLSSDLMEPFRILVDRWIVSHSIEEFSLTEKHKMVELLQSEVKIAGTKRVFTDAVGLYVQSVFKAMEEADVSLICFYEK